MRYFNKNFENTESLKITKKPQNLSKWPKYKHFLNTPKTVLAPSVAEIIKFFLCFMHVAHQVRMFLSKTLQNWPISDTRNYYKNMVHSSVLNFRENLVPTRIPTRIFAFEFGMQGLSFECVFGIVWTWFRTSGLIFVS
jgi:hypothetical protein